jgi:hypothetical protein
VHLWQLSNLPVGEPFAVMLRVRILGAREERMLAWVGEPNLLISKSQC